MESVLGEDKTRRLIVSLKGAKKWRLMDPIEIAESLEILCKHFSRDEVAKRLGISKRGTLWAYLKLLTLSEKVKDLIKARRIGQDVGYRISILDDPAEQETLAYAVMTHHLSSNELKAIVQNLKKRNLGLPIEECIRIALKARQKIAEEHVLVTKIQHNTLELLETKSQREKLPVEQLLRNSLLRIMPLTKIGSLKLINTTLIMSVGKEDFRLLKKEAQETKVKMEDLIDLLVNRGLTA